MKKIIISVLGKDRPGIIAAVSKTLLEGECNIENVRQTILQGEFSGIFIASVPGEESVTDINLALEKSLGPMGLYVHVKPLETGGEIFDSEKAEPFIISTRGPDRKGLVASITETIASHGVNVTNLLAVFEGGDDPSKNIMIYEVDIPDSTDQMSLQRELKEKAGQLGLEINIQHRNIFNTLNRI